MLCYIKPTGHIFFFAPPGYGKDAPGSDIVMKNTDVKNYFGRCALRLIVGALLFSAVLGCSENGGEEGREQSVTDHIGKGRAFYRQGNYEKAVEMYEKAVILDPGNAEGYLQLGIIYDDNIKDEEKAVEYYRRYLQLDPDSDKAQRVRKWLQKSRETELPSSPPAATPPPVSSRPLPPASAVEKPSPPQSAPPVIEETAASKNYTVKKGDTLAGISEKFYGNRTDWKLIYEANRKTLPSPHALKVGQTLIIPSKRKKAVIEL